MERLILKESSYEIKVAKVLNIKALTDQEKLFELAFMNGSSLNHDPGQFVQLFLPGVGEAPISICSSPNIRDKFELCVRRVGKFTKALHKLEKGDEIGVRGPFGQGFPVGVLEGNDLLIIAGGLGIVPLRSLINYIIEYRRDFGKVNILLGCNTPNSILFGNEIQTWEKRIDVNFNCTVDRGAPEWKGNIGVITTLIPGITLNPTRTFAIICGPPIMYKFVIDELVKKEIPEKQIFVSLERHMKCGIGKCGHCQIEHLYCCKDGPVFSYEKIKNVKGAI